MVESSAVNAKQSWPSAFVDTTIILSVVALCFVPSVSPMAWNVLGQIALVRFGVAVTKQAFGAGAGSSSSNGVPPSDRGSSGDVGSFPPPARRRSDPPSPSVMRRFAIVHAMPALLIAVVMLMHSCAVYGP